MSPLSIRPLAEDDREALREIWCGAWEATLPGIDFRARWPGMWQRWQDQVAAGGAAHVGEAAGRLAGFLLLTEANAYLDQIAVAPAAFGSPVARALLDFAKAASPGHLHLHVNQANPRAVRFYEREGFRRIGAGVNPTSGLPVWHCEWRRRE